MVVVKRLRYLYLALFLTFLLGVNDGYVALWKDGGNKPYQVFPLRIELLPKSDQQALERGILVTDESELNRLLEDYLS